MSPPREPAWPSDRRTFVSLGLQCVVNAFVYSTYVARLPDIRDGAAAGRTPGSAFTAMFVGNRLAGLLTPLAMGALAGTPLLAVGEAMVLLVVPSGALLLLLGTAAVRSRPTGRAAAPT